MRTKYKSENLKERGYLGD